MSSSGKVDVGFNVRNEAIKQFFAQVVRRAAQAGRRVVRKRRARRGRSARVMRSMTASACVRSILPLRNARCVNSPGSAARAPAVSKSVERAAGDEDAPVTGDFHEVLARVTGRGAMDAYEHVVQAWTRPATTQLRPPQTPCRKTRQLPAGQVGTVRLLSNSAADAESRSMAMAPAPNGEATAAMVAEVTEEKDRSLKDEG